MNDGQFESYLSRVLENDLSAEEFAEFERHLASSPEARAQYLDAVDVHNLLDLSLQAKIPTQRGISNVVDVQRIIGKQRRKSMRIAAMSAAAIFVIGLACLGFFMVKERPPALAFNTSPGTDFTLTHSKDASEAEGRIMEAGSRLHLTTGTVELSFASGVRSIVKAPADITLHQDDTLFVNQGTAWFEVPENAIGFTVKSKELTAVDLGTEFGVIVKPNDYDEVHVFKGKVRVNALGIRRESTTLVANQARRNDPIGRLDSIAANPSTFRKSLSELPPYLHWSFDQDDKFSVKGSHPDVGKIAVTPCPTDDPPQLVEGKRGSALCLNGNQQGLVTNWEGIYGADRPLSTAVWVRIPEGTNLTERPAIVGWGIPTESTAKWKVHVTHASTSKPAVARISMGGQFYDDDTRLDDNQWHHIAAVYRGRDSKTKKPLIELYIDGQRKNLRHNTAPIKSGNLDEYEEIRNSPHAKPLMIGKGLLQQDVTFHGLIDELYIFDGAISEETIKNMVTPNNKTTHKTNK